MKNIIRSSNKRQHTSYKLDMDQNFEPRDQKHNQLGFNERDSGQRKIKQIQD